MNKPFARGGLVALSIAASPVLAQLALEEVIVTAQKREQGLQDVPISIIAFSGERIDDAGITGLQELTLYTPNIKINAGSASDRPPPICSFAVSAQAPTPASSNRWACS